MLIRVLREALRTLRTAGWPAVGLAYLYLAAILIILPQPGLLLFLGLAAQNVVTFAVIRHLASHRGITAKNDGPALLTRGGQPVGAARRPGPVGIPDRSARHAVRNAGQLARPAMRLALLQLAAAFVMVTVLRAVGGESVVSGDRPTDGEVVRLLTGLAPISALLLAFVALAPQRIAIEGDHRVVLAAFASIRIAKTSYGTLFALSLAEPVLVLGAVAADKSVPLRIAAIVVLPLVHLVVLAALNEVYAAAPALVLPGAPKPKDQSPDD